MRYVIHNPFLYLCGEPRWAALEALEGEWLHAKCGPSADPGKFAGKSGNCGRGMVHWNGAQEAGALDWVSILARFMCIHVHIFACTVSCAYVCWLWETQINWYWWLRWVPWLRTPKSGPSLGGCIAKMQCMEQMSTKSQPGRHSNTPTQNAWCSQLRHPPRFRMGQGFSFLTHLLLVAFQGLMVASF